MVTLNDIALDADLFRRHAPHWPHPEPERGTTVSDPEFRYCPVCARQGNDDSRLGVERVHHVEGAPPEGLLADVCEQGHVFPLGNDDDRED
jgi:hypothetical protein